MRTLGTLILKELRMDWRSGQVLGALFLYVVSTCYVVYMAFQHIEDRRVWNAVLWLIILFAAFNAVSRSFDQERDGRGKYLFTMVSAQQLMLSKTIYTMLLLIGISLLACMVYAFFLPLSTSEIHIGRFLLGVVLVGAGLASTLTLVSAIAWKSQSNSGMVAILGFPLILPLLYSGMGYSLKVMNGTEWSGLWKYTIAIVSIDIIALALGYLLFPYIWRD